MAKGHAHAVAFENDVLKLTADGVQYGINNAGEIVDISKGKVIAVTDDALRTKIAKELEHAILDNPKLTGAQATQLDAVIANIGGSHKFIELNEFRTVVENVERGLAKVESVGKATTAEIQSLGAAMARHPNLEKALSPNSVAILADKTLGLDAAKAFSVRITGATKEIEDLVKGNKLTAEAAQKTLEKHGHEVVDHLPSKAQLPEVTAAKGTILKKIDELHGSLTGHYDDIVKHHGIIADKASDAKAIAEAEAALKKSAEAVAKIEKDNPAYVRHFDEAIEKHASKDLLRSGDIKGFEKHAEKMSTAAKSATAAVGDKAKLLGGGKWYSFVHSAESAGSQLEKIGKVRWGKAAIVGIPAAGIVAYATGAIGRNREVPGKYESQVLNQQQNVAEQGLGVA